MTTQLSFSKDENELLPDFRNKIGRAESTEDVKKIFAHTTELLLKRIFTSSLPLDYGDISLVPDGAEDSPPFTLSGQLTSRQEFTEIWGKSDLPKVLTRLAQSAKNRHKHLEKNPEKTNSKIRM